MLFVIFFRTSFKYLACVRRVKIFGLIAFMLSKLIPTFSAKSWRCFCLEDTKGLTRNRKAKTEKQCNGQKKNDKMTNNDLQYSTQKNKNRMRNMNVNDKQWIYKTVHKNLKIEWVTWTALTNNDLPTSTQKHKDRVRNMNVNDKQWIYKTVHRNLKIEWGTWTGMTNNESTKQYTETLRQSEEHEREWQTMPYKTVHRNLKIEWGTWTGMTNNDLQNSTQKPKDRVRNMNGNDKQWSTKQ